MKISSFDLNLFVILNAIYTEGSLTKAAEVVGILSQLSVMPYPD